jgi:putative inorganic carbon (HCO3(-)) transporter
MPLTAICFWISYLAGLAAALFNPAIGVALYVLVYHLSPESQWWGHTVRIMGLRTSFTVAAATAIGMAIRWPTLQNGARQFPTTFVLAVLLGVLLWGSLVWGIESTPRGEYQAQKFLKQLVFIFIMVRCISTPASFQLVILAWMIGLMYIGHQATGGVGQIMGGRLAYGVGGSDFADSSSLAVHMVASLPIIGAFFFMSRTWVGRSFALLTGAVTVNTIIMTRTRNAVVGLAAIALVGVMALPRGYRVRGFMAVIVGGVLALQLVDPGWWERIATISDYQSDSSAMMRIELWQAAVQMAMDYPLGVGVGNFRHKVIEYVPHLPFTRAAHNTYASCLAEIGWLGLLVFLTVLAFAVRQTSRAWHAAHTMEPFQEIRIGRFRTRFHLGWHAMALQAGLVGYLTSAAFTTRLWAEDLWLLIAMTVCLHNVSLEMASEGAPQPDPDALTTPTTDPHAPPAQPNAANPPAEHLPPAVASAYASGDARTAAQGLGGLRHAQHG